MNFLYLILSIIIILVVVNKFNNRGIHYMDIQTAQELIKDSTVTVIDVRTPQEFAQGHIKGARLIPVQELGERMSELASLKERQILVYCHSGNRSSTASRMLLKNGFNKIINLQGGIIAWNNVGNKTVKGN
ncbi:MAG: rhodanese-like domain-containing protein [Chitinivibrionales bacterium]